jgi:S-adenosylmethionine hydrolase
MTTPDACFLSPDNGILSYILFQYEGTSPTSDALPPGCKAYTLSNERYWHHPVSSTFHGRDIFAPVAAHLSLGVPPEELGLPTLSVERLPVEVPRWVDGVMLGRIAHVDRFGDLITDIPAEVIDGVEEIVVEVAGTRVSGLAGAYAEELGLLAIIGSYGYLEVSVRDGSAAARLSAQTGDPVRVIAGHADNRTRGL